MGYIWIYGIVFQLMDIMGYMQFRNYGNFHRYMGYTAITCNYNNGCIGQLTCRYKLNRGYNGHLGIGYS